MDMIGKVRRMHYRDHFSYSDIARRTGLSRNTVRKWLKAPVKVEPKYRRGQRPNKLAAYHEALKLALSADAHRPKHERRTAKALYAEIRCAGYEGGYTRVTDFIRAWHAGEGQTVSTSAFVPLAFELGEAFQFDWSEEGLVVGGIYYRLQVAHMKLCASRAFWLVAYPSRGHEMLFDAHTRSFAALGGIARRGIYDLHVDGRGQGAQRQGPHRQRALRRHVRALPVGPRPGTEGPLRGPGNVASGWEKGRVEKNVQDSGRRIWIDAGQQRFGSFVELNAWLAARCRALWEEVRHPEHSQFSVAEMLDHERPHLMPVPTPFDGLALAARTPAAGRDHGPCDALGEPPDGGGEVPGAP